MANKKYLDYAGLSTLVEEIENKYGLRGAMAYKGTVQTISALPTVATCRVGDMYNVVNGGTTTDDFAEGAGHEFNAGDNVVAINIAPDDAPAVMKWDVLGGIFILKDKLTFGSSMPLNPQNNDTFLYLGNTSYVYTSVTPEEGDNPKAKYWYEYDSETEQYVETEDTTVEPGKTYYERHEQYVKGVIYVWNGSGQEWVPQSSGDIMVPITSEEISDLFR